MRVGIFLLKINLKVIYFFLKLLPTKNNKITFMSRQSSKPTVDFILLKQKLLEENSNLVIVELMRKMTNIKGVLDAISYYFHILKQMYHIATSKVCVIDSYIIPISILKHKKKMKVYQLWHALGIIKKFGYQTLDKSGGRDKKMALQMKMHENYDYIIASSKKSVVSLSEAFHTSQEHFLITGLPRLDYLRNQKSQIRAKILKRYPKLNKKKVILYAPTFRSNKRNEIQELVKEIDFSRYHLIIRGHPIKEIEVGNEKIYTCPKFTTLELLTIADYIITDYSGIAIEASVLKKPVYFYVYDYEEYIKSNGLNIDIYEEMPGCVFQNVKDLLIRLRSQKYELKYIERLCQNNVDIKEGESATELIAKHICNIIG